MDTHWESNPLLTHFHLGLVDPDGKPIPSVSDTIRPTEGGIHPREAADHHVDISTELFSKLLANNNLTSGDISGVAYSQGQGWVHVCE